jgi:hypothetical protein
VAEYHLHLLDRNGRIARRVELQGCVDDDHACDVAAAYPHHGRMELWREDRLVETFGDLRSDQA